MSTTDETIQVNTKGQQVNALFVHSKEPELQEKAYDAVAKVTYNPVTFEIYDVAKKEYSGKFFNPEPEDIEEEPEEIEEPKSKDEHSGIDGVGRNLYFGCFAPDGYSISGNGIFKRVMKYDKFEKDYIEEWIPICSIRVMVTGRFVSLEGSHIVEITYIDKSEMKSIYAPLAAILGVKEFKETLRPQNLRIDDFQLKEMIPFFRKCIDENEKEGGTAFKTGLCFNVTGWKDPEFTKFNAGNRYFEDVNGTLKESKCIYTDEDTATIFDPRGTIEAWVNGVRPLMQYDRVRFVCYAAFAAVLLRFLKVDSFTIDLYGGIAGANNDKSSSGKTTSTEIALSCFGNVKGDGSLFNTCASTNNFIENIAAKFVDLALLLDESTKLSDNDRDELSYRTSSRTTKGRAKDGMGNNQKSRQKSCVALVTGEEPLIRETGNIGAKIRVISIEGGIGVARIGSLVEKAHDAVLENSGHLLKPFLSAFFKNRKFVMDWFTAARERLKESTSNDMVKRQASYFAAIETAGYLLELIFEKIRIEKKSPQDVVRNVWNDSVSSHETQPAWKDALRDTWDWYQENKEVYFAPGENRKVYGWTWSDKDGKYLELIPKSHKDELLKKHPRNYEPKMTYRSWKEAGVTNVTDDKKSKDPIDKNVTRYGESKRVIQINIKKLCEILEIGDCSENFW